MWTHSGPPAIASDDGEQLADVGRGIELCYETFGDPADPPLLLVMGLGMQMVHWHPALIAQLVERGLHVIRFDNRDRGRSTHVRVKPPSLTQLLTRRFDPAQYRLEDMAADTAGLLDALELDDAHVVGISMGGMIAQTLAALHPQRVRSLTSIMSTTGSRWVGQPKPRIYPLLLRPGPRERDRFVEAQLKMLTAIGAPGDLLDTPEARAYLAGSYDRDPAAVGTA
ncbi:MAG TPA: alpha/beta fold hydrolase, partial [Conexibacter sp.]|nr:alpha/beta fold hydrolase [Conexibacter sp.]